VSIPPSLSSCFLLASSPLNGRLRAFRYRRAAEACGPILDGLGVSEERRQFLELADLDALLPSYIARLRAGGDTRDQRPAERHEEVRRRTDSLRDATSGLAVVWFASVGQETVAVEVPADPLLAAGLDYLVSRAADLMLTTRDLADGLCMGLNHFASGDEYELVTWGRFSG
jgi:hypothetical protein